MKEINNENTKQDLLDKERNKILYDSGDDIFRNEDPISKNIYSDQIETNSEIVSDIMPSDVPEFDINFENIDIAADENSENEIRVDDSNDIDFDDIMISDDAPDQINLGENYSAAFTKIAQIETDFSFCALNSPDELSILLEQNTNAEII